MFKDAKVGDRVWSLLHGWGKIIDVNLDLTGRGVDYESYPIKAMFDDNYDGSFTVDGKFNDSKYGNQVLFWDEVKITPPPKPKKIISKTILVEPTDFNYQAMCGGQIATEIVFNIGSFVDANLNDKIKVTLNIEE
jgi:hypothetical protein